MQTREKQISQLTTEDLTSEQAVNLLVSCVQQVISQIDLHLNEFRILVSNQGMEEPTEYEEIRFAEVLESLRTQIPYLFEAELQLQAQSRYFLSDRADSSVARTLHTLVRRRTAYSVLLTGVNASIKTNGR